MFSVFDNQFLFDNLKANEENYKQYVQAHPKIGGYARTLLSFDWNSLAIKDATILRVTNYLRYTEIGCSQPVFTAEGPNGTGKTHIITGMCRWLILNKGLSYPGYELEWVNWPAYIKDRLDGKLLQEPNWKAMILVLEDIDSALAISPKTQNAYGLRELLAILRPRIEANLSLPTLMSLNKSLRTNDSYPLMEALSRDTNGEVVPDAAKNARTLTDLLIGSSVRAIFTTKGGRSYRDTVLSSLANWKSTNAQRHLESDPLELLGLEGKY